MHLLKMAADQQPLHGKEYDSAGDPRPRKKTCTGFCCCKLLVVIYGFLFLIIGLLLLAIGVWIEDVRKDYESINDALSSPSILAIVVGIFMVITALIGLVGAVKENLVLLKVFLAIIIIVFIFQVIIGIIAFVYREETARVASKQLNFAVEEYHKNNDFKRAVDAVQHKLKCCGLDNQRDWNENDEYSCSSGSPHSCSVPDSCCRDMQVNCGINVRGNLTMAQQTDRIYTEGCSWNFRQWVEERLDILGACALGFAIPQILGIFLVYTYITKVEDRKHLFQYSKYRKRFIPDQS